MLNQCYRSNSFHGLHGQWYPEEQASEYIGKTSKDKRTGKGNGSFAASIVKVSSQSYDDRQ